ncbi:glycosyltransferase family 2 protein [Clostridium sp. VAP51]|uniref:glycosyltransferase family 2 protein n=1 Tax=Clostridium sp. VAP51 TaxID=2949978 RepID=UPI0020799AC9|nr:glycosyltransferase family 2 protein [Clostridium sp. VAP51]
MNKIGEKLITFVVPAYNIADYIDQCIQSILNQTEQDFKIIIVDDGSTDNMTFDKGKQYAEKYSDIVTFISQENKGLGGARNTGMDKVETKYMMFLDSDDWIDINFVKNLKSELNKVKTDLIDIIFAMPTIYDNLSGEYIDWYDKEVFKEIFGSNRICNPYENKKVFKLEPNVCRRVFRTEFIKNINFQFDEHVKYEDVYPHFYLLDYAKKCMGLDITSFYYRINRPNQITSLQNETRLDVVKVFAKTLEYLIKTNKEEEIIYCAMDMMMNFSFWCINNSHIHIRKKLIEQLAKLYIAIPKSTWKKYNKSRKNKKVTIYSYIMRYKFLRRIFNDYAYVEIGKHFIIRGTK